MYTYKYVGGSGDNFRIFVRDVDRVALVGKIDIMCFDKTGTITKSGLDLIGFLPADSAGAPGGSGSDGHGLVPFYAAPPTVGQGGGQKEEGGQIPQLMTVGLAVTHTGGNSAKSACYWICCVK